MYATTLHYAPCQCSEEGFRCVIVLPLGTNGELTGSVEVKNGEDRLLFARNKWLVGHEEGRLPDTAWIGLKGDNISLQQ